MKCINVFYGDTPVLLFGRNVSFDSWILKVEAINSMKIGVEGDTGRHGPRRGD